MTMGAIGVAVAGGVASAAAGAAISGMFGNEGEVNAAYGPASKASTDLMEQQLQRGKDWGRWAYSQIGELDALTKQVLANIDPKAAEMMALASGAKDTAAWVQGVAGGLNEAGQGLLAEGQGYRDYHQGTYQPLEQEWIQDYQSYASDERKTQEEARAAADVNQSFEAQRANALRQLEGYGIDPGQARHGALDLNVRLAQAAQQAQAQTQARLDTEATARQMRQDILNYGTNYQDWGQALTNAGLGAQEAAGNMGGVVGDLYNTSGRLVDASGRLQLAGLEGAQNTARVSGNLAGIEGSYYSGANSANANQINAAGGYTSALNTASSRYDALGQEIGGAVAEGLGNAIDKWTQPKNTAPVQEGPTRPPITGSGYAGGGEIRGPGGPYQDAIPIRASDGEYMVPFEVVHRKGTEFFDKLVAKTRAELSQTQPPAQALPM